MRKPEAPCKDCKDRQGGCHATCEPYRVYEEAANYFREQRIERNNTTAMISTYHRERSAIIRRKISN